MKKITIIRERDSYENGVTCLAMIFMHYGFKNIRDALRHYTNAYCSMATSILDLKDAANKMGFETKALKFQQKANLNEVIFEKDNLPGIVFCHDPEHKRNAFMIVYKQSNKYVWVIDTIKGKVKIPLLDFYEIWHHILIVITPTERSFTTTESLKLLEHFSINNRPHSCSENHFMDMKKNFQSEIRDLEKVVDIAIIGGGPSGIHCGVEAKKNNLSCLMFDKKNVLGELKSYPQEMTFVSNPEDFQLGKIPFDLEEKIVKTSDLVKYYESIVKKQKLSFKTEESVLSITKLKHGFQIHTKTNKYFALNIIVATGGDIDRTINIPGINTSKVSQSFTHAYSTAEKYSNTKVAIIGGGISAVSLATKLCNNKAKVNIIHRGATLKWTVNPVIDFHFPEIYDFLEQGKLTINYNSKIEKIEKTKISFQNTLSDEISTIDNDYVFIMIGKEPSNTILKNLQVKISKHCPFPILNPETLETSQQGVFVAGSAIGQAVFRHFENHASKIISEIRKRLQS